MRFVLTIHAEEWLCSYIHINFGEALENDNFQPTALKMVYFGGGTRWLRSFSAALSRPDFGHWKSLSKWHAKLKGLPKRKMFVDQTSSNIIWWPNMMIWKWVAKRLKQVWSNSYPAYFTHQPDFNMAKCETSFRLIAIQRFKFKKSTAITIHLAVLEEDGKIENRRGKTRS